MIKKMKRTFVILDLIEMGLLVVAFALLFILFMLDNTVFSYFFLLIDLIIIIRFSFALSELDKDREEYVAKYKNNKVMAKYLKKVSL